MLPFLSVTKFFSYPISALIAKTIEIWQAHVATLTNDPQ